jgi:hypothetical protein
MNIIRNKSYNHLNRYSTSLGQNSTYLHDKSPEKLETDETYLNIIKDIYDNPITNIF